MGLKLLLFDVEALFVDMSARQRRVKPLAIKYCCEDPYFFCDSRRHGIAVAVGVCRNVVDLAKGILSVRAPCLMGAYNGLEKADTGVMEVELISMHMDSIAAAVAPVGIERHDIGPADEVR